MILVGLDTVKEPLGEPLPLERHQDTFAPAILQLHKVLIIPTEPNTVHAYLNKYTVNDKHDHREAEGEGGREPERRSDVQVLHT